MDTHVYSVYAIVVAFSYLIGSIPFGLVLGKVFKVGDLRTIGSGNIGATNALRTGNKKFALAVLFCDGIKGAVAIWIAQYLVGDVWPHAGLVAGLAAVIGHVFPVWLKFKGGKGVATCAGVLLALHWPAGVLALVIWLLTAKLSRYSSMGAVVAAVNAPIYALATGAPAYALPFAFLGALLLWTHRENIKRLSRGEESTIKLKKQ
jgi:acyl phosphate:glycerol-3-phosphate acyltransferase